MENTIENKERFFALYFGVRCLKNSLLNESLPPSKVEASSCKGLPQQYLKLKPLSKISDEDAIAIADILRWGLMSKDRKVSDVKTWLSQYLNYHNSNVSFNESIYVADFLRSKGYLIGWTGLTPEQIIEYGWAVTE